MSQEILLAILKVLMAKRDSFLTVKIKTTNLDFTPLIESYVREKIQMLEKFLKHYQRKSGELIFEVEIGKTTRHHKSGDVFRAEINFTAGDTNLRAEAVKDDLYAAIDKAKDEMRRELRRRKGRHMDLIRKGGAKIKDIAKGLYRQR